MADLLCIHHVENFEEKITATTHKSMSLAEAAQLYNLTLKFEAVHYISGNNDTEENAYSQLEEDGTFTPCYVNDKEESVVIPEGSTEKIGRSAIGRRPAVLVKLVDAANNVVLAGYIKLEITEKPLLLMQLLLTRALRSCRTCVVNKLYPSLGKTCPVRFLKNWV